MAARSPVRSLVLPALVLLLASPNARAQQTGGVLLRWDHCTSDAGTVNRMFACDTNAGTEVLVASFRLGTALEDPVFGFNMNFRVTSASVPLPAWWAVVPGTCRGTGLGSTPDPPAGSVNCVEWAPGLGALSGISPQLAPLGSNSYRIPASVSAPASATLAGGLEYFAISLLVRHLKTVGTGSCAGCSTPVCIAFENITFEQAVFPVVYSAGADGEGSRFVSWQGSEPRDVQTSCQVQPGDRLVCTTTFGCAAAAVTRARGSTWGQVKSLYR